MVPYAECDVMIDNQFEAQILHHIYDSSLFLSPGIAAFMTVNIMQIPRLELQHVARVLDWIFIVFPHYSLCASISSVHSNYAINKVCSMLLNNSNSTCVQPHPCCKSK
jgi:hypothetical protein